jgi:FtsH-binding integral membrane protein
MIILCGALLAAAWQSLAMDAILGNQVRRLTIEHSLYFERAGLQKLTTVAAAVGLASVIAWITTRSLSRRTRTVLISLASLLALSTISIVSLHSVDRLANVPYWNMPLIEWLKIAVTVLGVAGSLLPANR